MRPKVPAAKSTAVLAVDADMWRRINEGGVSGGLLGDPPPGRSALERKIAGLDETEVRKPTLASQAFNAWS